MGTLNKQLKGALSYKLDPELIENVLLTYMDFVIIIHLKKMQSFNLKLDSIVSQKSIHT